MHTCDFFSHFDAVCKINHAKRNIIGMECRLRLYKCAHLRHCRGVSGTSILFSVQHEPFQWRWFQRNDENSISTNAMSLMRLDSPNALDKWTHSKLKPITFHNRGKKNCELNAIYFLQAFLIDFPSSFRIECEWTAKLHMTVVAVARAQSACSCCRQNIQFSIRHKAIIQPASRFAATQQLSQQHHLKTMRAKRYETGA